MIKTKLIMFEGPPGSGKSTSAQRLTEKISETGRDCQCFLEWSPDHPIAIGDDFHLGQVIATSRIREDKMLHQWQQFARKVLSEDSVTVIESRFWQTSVMLMYAAGLPREKVFESNQRVMDAIQGLDPVLIVYSIDDIRTFTTRVIELKEAEWKAAGFDGGWAQHIYDALEPQPWFIDRGLTGLTGYIAFLEEWAKIAEDLYQRVPFQKTKIINPFKDWSLSTQQIHTFLDLI